MLKGVQGWGGGGGGCSPQSGNIPAIITCKIFLFDEMQIHNLALLVPNSFGKILETYNSKIIVNQGERFLQGVVVSTSVAEQKKSVKKNTLQDL